MRYSVILSLICTVLFVSAAQAEEGPQSKWTQDQIETINAVSGYLNSIGSMTARFTQIASDGSFAEGTMYMDRPGKVRFDYDHDKLSVIASGLWLGMWDKELDYVDRMPLWDTPLAVLLKEDLDLLHQTEDIAIANVMRSQGVLTITVFDTDNPDQGTLTLLFEDGPMILRRWEAMDATGQTTIVVLSDIETGMELSPKLFRLPNI